jgi:GxxExxY protein
MGKIVLAEESYKITGVCFAVYKEMGCGFLESVYQECLTLEFKKQAISFEAQPELKLNYGSVTLKQHFIPDFICFDKIMLEIKAVSCIIDEHRAQLINYLNATKKELGILVNFGHYPKLEYQRFLLNTPPLLNKFRPVRVVRGQGK